MTQDNKDKQDFLNTLLETISNPIFYKDVEGKYTGCNKAFENFVGKPRAEIVGKTVYEMAPKEIADKYHERDAELFKIPGKQRYEWKAKRADEEFRDIIFDKATLHDTNGNISEVKICVFKVFSMS